MKKALFTVVAVLLGAISTQLACADALIEPAAYWSLDEDHGTNVPAIPNLYNGLISGSGSQWVQGAKGNALSFSYSDDVVTVGDHFDLGTNTYSFSCWMKTTPGANGQAMMAKATWDNYWSGYWLGVHWANSEPAGVVAFVLGDGSKNTVLQGSTRVDDDEWHHVVAVIHRDREAEIYVDGQLETLTLHPDNGPWSSLSGSNSETTTPFTLGATADDSSYDQKRFLGRLDEVYVFDGAVSEEQVQALYQDRSPIDNPDFYLTFDELNTGQIISADSNALVGTVNGAVLAAEGVVDGAYEFDGIDDDIVFSGDSVFDATNFTVCAWVRSADYGESFQKIIDTKTSSFAAGGFNLHLVDNSLEMSLRYETGQYGYVASDIFDDSDNGQWHHVAGTHSFDGTNSTGRLYLDGELVHEQTYATAPPVYGMQDIRVGNNYDSGPSWKREFHGDMDELRLYHKVLGSSEIAELYAATAPSDINEPDFMLTFDESAGTGPSFGTDYALWDNSSEAIDAGYYWIGPNPNDEHFRFASFTDHTTGSGDMMVFNAGLAPSNAVWSTSVAVEPGEVYNFSAWVAAVYYTVPAELQLYINGEAIGDIFSLTQITGEWLEMTASWNNGEASVAELELRVLDSDGEGNDFALDDISFTSQKLIEPSIYLSFDEWDGNAITNEGTVNISGTVNGPVLNTNGYLNGSYTFDGSDDQIVFVGNDVFDVTNFTYLAWVRSDNYTSGSRVQIIVDSATHSLSQGGANLYVINNGLGMTMRYQGGSYRQYRAPNLFDSADNGTWHHVAASHQYDGGISVCRLFLDGDEVFAITNATPPTYYGGQSVYVGDNYDSGYTREFDGDIDELRLYHRSMDAQEISMIRDYVIPPPPPPVVLLESIEIAGPDSLDESSQESYACVATYSDGSSVDVSSLASWSEDQAFSYITDSGELHLNSVDVETNVMISAEFEGMTAEITVLVLDANPSLKEFSFYAAFDSGTDKVAATVWVDELIVRSISEVESGDSSIDIPIMVYGDVFGATLTREGYLSNAFHFDGVDDQVVFPGMEPFDVVNFTQSAWVRSAEYGDVIQVIMDTATGDLARGGVNLYLINKGVGMTCRYEGGVYHQYRKSDLFTPLDDDQWHHIAATHFYDGEHSTGRLYLDGELVFEETVVTPAPTYDMQDLYIGDNYDAGYQREFNGNIDELYLYDRALNGSEIAELAQMSGAGSERALVSIDIEGPDEIDEGADVVFTCIATYSDGSTSDVSSLTKWMDTSDYADMDSTGKLEVAILGMDSICSITATYDGLEAIKEVDLFDVYPNDAPLQLEPGNDTRILNYMGLPFEWTPLPDVEWYRVLILKYGTGELVVNKWVDRTRYLMSANDLSDGNFIWWVVGLTADGEFTEWSQPFRFCKNRPAPSQPVAPNEDGVTSGDMMEFKWSTSHSWVRSVDQFRWYKLVVLDDTGKTVNDVDALESGWFTEKPGSVGSTAEEGPNQVAQVKFPTELRPGEYRWWVQAVDFSGSSLWSERGTFVVGRQIEPGVIGAELGQGAVISDTTPILRWKEVSWATHYDILLTVVPDGGTRTTVYIDGKAGDNYELSEQAVGDYSWQIRATNPANGWAGAWGPAAAFQITAP